MDDNYDEDDLDSQNTSDVHDPSNSDPKAEELLNQMMVQGGDMNEGFKFYKDVYEKNPNSSPFTFEGSIVKPDFKSLVKTIRDISHDPTILQDKGLWNKWIEFASNTLGVPRSTCQEVFSDDAKLEQWTHDLQISLDKDKDAQVNITDTEISDPSTAELTNQSSNESKQDDDSNERVTNALQFLDSSVSQSVVEV